MDQHLLQTGKEQIYKERVQIKKKKLQAEVLKLYST